MTLSFSDRPGPRERHLRRKYHNPLFHDAGPVTLQTLVEARRLDLADAEAFREELLQLVEEAASLPAQADSETVLGLKERLDKAYERACGLTGDQSRAKQAIQRLLGVIMKAVRRGAANDPLAQEQLDQEERARRAHFALLEHPLIADLLSPDNPIPPDEVRVMLLRLGRFFRAVAVDASGSGDDEQLVVGREHGPNGALDGGEPAVTRGDPVGAGRESPRAGSDRNRAVLGASGTLATEAEREQTPRLQIECTR